MNFFSKTLNLSSLIVRKAEKSIIYNFSNFQRLIRNITFVMLEGLENTNIFKVIVELKELECVMTMMFLNSMSLKTAKSFRNGPQRQPTSTFFLLQSLCFSYNSLLISHEYRQQHQHDSSAV